MAKTRKRSNRARANSHPSNARAAAPREDESAAEAFLRALRTHATFEDVQRFGAWIERRHGSAGRDVAREAVDYPHGVHHARLASVSLALDHAFGLRGDELAVSLEWLDVHSIRLLPDAGRILDVGADIGLRAAFEALLSPGSSVQAIEFEPRAVAIATELAGRLAVDNVTFTAASPEAFFEQRPEPFDFVRVSRHVIEDAIPAPAVPDYWDIADLDATTQPPPAELFAALKTIVAPDGVAAFEISAGSGGAFLWWARTIAASGWDIDLEMSDHTILGPEVFAREAVTLAARPSDEPKPIPVQDLVSFLAQKLLNFATEAVITGAAAEAMLIAFEGKRLLLGTELAAEDEPPRRTELFEAGPLLLIARSLGGDARDLLFEAAVAREAVLRLLYLTARIDAELLQGSVRYYGPEAERMAEVGEEIARRLPEVQRAQD